MKYLVLIVFAVLLCALAPIHCDYYGEGFPVHGPLHGGMNGAPGIRYKKIPFPYRSARNLGLGHYSGSYLDPYYGGRYGPAGILSLSVGFSPGLFHNRYGYFAGYAG